MSSASTAKDKNAELAKALGKYEAMKKLHMEAQAAYAGAKSAAAEALADYNAAVKAHCDAEAVHAAAVEAIGHGQFKKDECTYEQDLVCKWRDHTAKSLQQRGKKECSSKAHCAWKADKRTGGACMSSGFKED